MLAKPRRPRSDSAEVAARTYQLQIPLWPSLDHLKFLDDSDEADLSPQVTGTHWLGGGEAF